MKTLSPRGNQKRFYPPYPVVCVLCNRRFPNWVEFDDHRIIKPVNTITVQGKKITINECKGCKG